MKPPEFYQSQPVSSEVILHKLTLYLFLPFQDPPLISQITALQKDARQTPALELSAPLITQFLIVLTNGCLLTNFAQAVQTYPFQDEPILDGKINVSDARVISVRAKSNDLKKTERTSFRLNTI